MSEPNVYQQLGALQAQVKTLEERTESMDGKLDTLLQQRAKEQGARGMLWKVGTISSAVTTLVIAIATWWVETFGGHHQ